jgi:hypothetical protein
MGVRYAEDVFANVRLDLIEVLACQFQILILSSDISSAVARQEKPLGLRLTGHITAIVRDHPPARFQGRVPKSKKTSRFLGVQMMYQPQGKDNIESGELLHCMPAYPFADELATVTVPLSRESNTRRISIHTEILAIRKKWQHIARAATDIQNTVMRLRPNILTDEDTATVVGPDQRVVELVKKGTIQDRAHAFNHIGHS